MNPLFYVVYAMHVIISLFSMVGFLLPRRFLIYHIVIVVISIISWFVMGNKCIFAVVEDKLREENSTYMNNYKTPFLTHWGSLIGFHVEPHNSTTITDSLILIAFAISCIRLFILKK